jgi:CBS domain-containing protein
MAKSVQELMSSNPRAIAPDQTVVDAAKIMRDENVGIAPVTEGDRLVGTITDRDITIRVVAEAKDPSSTKVLDVASKDIVAVEPHQDLSEALRLMAQHQVRRLPVVEEDGRLVGILAQADVALASDDTATGELVEEISK